MTTCAYLERVAALAAGEPDDDLRAHLPGCAACRAELDEARRVLRALGELHEPARAAERAEGELFWADFARGVKTLHERERGVARRAGRRWLVGGGVVATLAAAALALWLGGGGARVAPGAGAGAGTQATLPDLDADDLAPEPSPEDAVEVLDDDGLDAVLARLEAATPPPADPPAVDGVGPDVDPLDTVESLDDDALDDVLEALSTKGA